jgi:acetaldehyde dehydrogenase/alcohol dehydrogenase
VLSLFTAANDEEALSLCASLLEHAGTGHTAIIHTASSARADRYADAMPASRIIVNSPGAQGCCGMTTGLPPSMTLGCGTLGGNSTTDNVTYRQLLNIKRVAHHLV